MRDHVLFLFYLGRFMFSFAQSERKTYCFIVVFNKLTFVQIQQLKSKLSNLDLKIHTHPYSRKMYYLLKILYQ